MFRYFSSWPTLAVSLYKTLPASKIAKCPYDSPTLTCAKGAKIGPHEEYQRFAAWSLERLVRNVHELAKNLSWNEGAARAAISTHNKKSSAVYLLCSECALNPRTPRLVYAVGKSA
jgi:hypothetical protein